MAEKLTESFTREEFECKCGCGLNTINLYLVHLLQNIRNIVQFPLVITSGLRCEKQNKAEGGEPDSAHLTGMAADLLCKDSRSRYLITKAAYDSGFKRIGEGKTFIHLDIDSVKDQDVKWRYD